MATNGSKIRVILFDVYSKEQRQEMDIEQDEDRLNMLKENKINNKLIESAYVNKLENYVVGAIQSDKKVKKSFFKGDTYIINKFIKLYENYINSTYTEDDNTTIIGDDNEAVITRKFNNGSFVRFTRVKDIVNNSYNKDMLSFFSEGIVFNTIKQVRKPHHAAPFKDWTWEEDIDFENNLFKRKVVSLFAKNLSQLRQEKDLSWYYNKDGTPKKDYKVFHTLNDVKDMIDSIESIRNSVIVADKNKVLPISVDCETTGLKFNSLPRYDEDGDKNVLKDEIGGISISWLPDQGVYIPFLHTKFENVPREECLTLLKPYLEEWYIETHNGLFDGKVFLDYGIKLNIQDDSMIMLFNINPTVAKGSKGLKENTMYRYGHETLDHDDVFPAKDMVESFFDLDEDIVKIYTCADSDYTHKLCSDLRKEIPSIRAYRLDIRVMRYLIKVNYNGNRVDDKLLNMLSTVVDEDIKTLEELMFKFVGQIGQLTQATKIMEQQVALGNMSKDEIPRLLDELKHEESFKSSRYKFSPSKPDVLVDIIYNRLAYPIVRVSKTSGKPTADKFALKDLAREMLEDGMEGNWLKEDVLSSAVKYSTDLSSKDRVLIDANKFNKMKYPFVYLLQEWKDRIKLKTTFFAWFLNGSCDNMYYSDFSLTNAETSRIIGRIQTLKGAMKQLIVPYSDDYYLMGVDFSQIEARLMAYLANKWELVERLCNPRADYHVESAAVLTGKEAWQISKSERGELKSVNFAVPYGMAEYSLAENLYGRPVTEEKVNKPRVLLSKWKKANWEIQALLDSYRKFANETHDMKFFNKERRVVEVTPIRSIINKFGRRRLFIDGVYSGDNLSPKVKASIDRMAGNYPIQAYAADIFKTAFVNINKRLEKEGLEDKVFFTALVHDEFLMNVHRSVDKYKMFEILWEEMVQSIYLPFKDDSGNWVKKEDGTYDIDKDHPIKFFFAGISIGPEWHDIHGNDAHETPTEYLQYIVEKIKSGEYKFKDYEDGDVTEECFNETRDYMRNAMLEECKKLQEDFAPNNVKFYKIVPAFYDYFLKGRLKIYQKSVYRDINKGDEDDDIRARLEAIIMDLCNVDSLKCYDSGDNVNEFRIVSKNTPDSIDSNEDSSDKVLTSEDNLSDFGDLFGDLFEEDLDNYDDDEDSDFDISIPVFAYKKVGAEYSVISKRSDPNDKRDIWDLVDFNKEIKTYTSSISSKYLVRSDTIFIDVSGADVENVRKLVRYINSKNSSDGMLSVKLKINDNIKDTGVKVMSLNHEEVYSIMGWSILSVV